MSANLRTPFGWFNDEQDRIDTFNEILTIYQRNNVSGGSLHIYLEDGNDSLSDIRFCETYAQEKGDWIGMYLCGELLHFGENFIKDLIKDNKQ